MSNPFRIKLRIKTLINRSYRVNPFIKRNKPSTLIPTVYKRVDLFKTFFNKCVMSDMLMLTRLDLNNQLKEID